MIEIKVPKDLESIKSTSFLNLKRKEVLYALITLILVISTSIYLALTSFLPQQIIMIIAIIITLLGGTPIVIERSGMFGVGAEEFIVNFIHFLFTKKHRHYEYEEKFWKEN